MKPRTRFSSTHVVHAGSTDLAISPRYRVGNGSGFVPVRSSVGLTLKPRIKCFLCNGGHKLETCGQSRAKSSEEKLKFVRDRRLCENCLSYSHFASGCKSPQSCTIEQCTTARKHLQSLHDALVASFRSIETAKGTMKEFLDQVLINSPPIYTRNKVITLLSVTSKHLIPSPKSRLCLLGR